jgi:dipeptidyl-peptidase-4
VIAMKLLRWTLLVVPLSLAAQDRLKSVPGYERAQRHAREASSAVSGGAPAAAWLDGSDAFEYERDGRHYRYDVKTRRATEIAATEQRATPRRRPGFDNGPEPERGRQFDVALSPDGKRRAYYDDRNLWVSDADGGDARAVTTDGSAASRIKYGTASWVYGEELSQHAAMWWSPDSRRLAYYRFDERQVHDYYVTMNQTQVQATLDVEAFPTAGAPNPVVDLFIYDVASKQTVRANVRDGQAFDNAGVGHYVYRVSWSPDGRELLFLRTNRRQNVMELAAADARTGATRAVVREESAAGWVMSEPRMVFLEDGRRFVWESQRTGWNNFYLYDLKKGLITALTRATAFEAAALVKIDEDAGALFYTARDGDNRLKVQLHRVDLDGRNDRRLTDPAFHHSIGGCIPELGARPEQPAVPRPCDISPDSRHFVDVRQTHDRAPATRLADARTGETLADVAASDTSKFAELGLKTVELFTYAAADGRTPLYGLLHFPASFDPAKQYPALVTVYGAPEFAVSSARESFVVPSALTEYGFLVVQLDTRGVPGTGKAALDALYQRLGQAEIDDLAAGVRSLWSRPYVDRSRVGIFGTSYGGYASVMALLRHPDVFAAASASSPASDWRNYDTIYTERYMGLPQDNKDGYDAGSAITYAKALRGRLLIYYGTADNNVHPSNSLQLIKALQDAGKSFDVQVGPDQGHTSVNQERMMEFFVEALRPTP